MFDSPDLDSHRAREMAAKAELSAALNDPDAAAYLAGFNFDPSLCNITPEEAAILRPMVEELKGLLKRLELDPGNEAIKDELRSLKARFDAM